jgi:hypothetical protein
MSSNARLASRFTRELSEQELCESERAPLSARETRTLGVLIRHVVRVKQRAEGRPRPLCVHQILHRERYAMQQLERFPVQHGPFGCFCCSHGLVAADGDEAVQLRLQALGTVEDGARDLEG